MTWVKTRTTLKGTYVNLALTHSVLVSVVCSRRKRRNTGRPERVPSPGHPEDRKRRGLWPVTVTWGSRGAHPTPGGCSTPQGEPPIRGIPLVPPERRFLLILESLLIHIQCQTLLISTVHPCQGRRHIYMTDARSRSAHVKVGQTMLK